MATPKQSAAEREHNDDDDVVRFVEREWLRKNQRRWSLLKNKPRVEHVSNIAEIA